MTCGGGGPFRAPTPASASASQSQYRRMKLKMRFAAVGMGGEGSDDEGGYAMAQSIAAVDAVGGTMSATLKVDRTSGIECDEVAHKVL